jgi:hypothetical protein
MVKNHRDALEVPRKRRIPWTLISVVLFLLGLSVDYMFFHVVFKEKWNGITITPGSIMTKSPTSPLASPPPAPSASITESMASPHGDSSGSLAPEVLQKFQKEIAHCFGADSPLAKSTNTDRLVEQILASNPTQKAQLEVENTHVRLKDGSIRRLHLIPSDTSSSQSAKELRYYSLDNEGLPVLIPLPEERRLNPTPEFLASLLSEGTVVFHQLKENRFLKDGSHLSLNTINTHVFEFQLFSKEKTFSCRELECQCR